MKKSTISFITVHVGFNFGSKLQTIATYEIFKKLGYDPICVNYIPPRVTWSRFWSIGKINPLKLLKRIFFFPFYYITRCNYDRYLDKYCKLSHPFLSKDNFKVNCPKADIYVTGSDQLWNFKHNEGKDIHYFFEGIEGKKIAFASSIGMTSLPDDYVAYMKEQLSHFHAISVREQSAVHLLQNMGLSAIQLLDPTFMLNKKDWVSFASKRLVKKPYLFVYIPYNIKDKGLIYKTAHKIAEMKNLKIVTYSDYMIKEPYADQTIYFVNPGDILSLILHADVVLTNSFHGTAFSINLNKQFWTYMPSSFSTRITSILHLCDLSYRLLDEEITDEQIMQGIDFDHTNAILQEERYKTYNFLTQALR